MPMKTLLNDGWEYLKLPAESTIEQALLSEDWSPVDLPHDWLIWQHKDLYENADAWYRRELYMDHVPETCMIHFDGVYMDCDVLLNGRVVCSHAYGYTAFYADLTEKLQVGKNRICVHIRHRSPNSRWYSGSGIFRDVHLIELPADHIVPDSFYLKERENDGGWELDISAETKGTDRVLFSCSVCDADGTAVATGQQYSEQGFVRLKLQMKGIFVWDVDHPYLYSLQYQYGSETGRISFGMRSIEFTSDRGMILNHRPLKIHGVCLHHDLGALGSAFHRKAARRQLLLMKEMGANAVRTSHNPPASAFLDLCDELGMLVVDEAFDMWERPKTEFDYARFFRQHEKEDIALWVRRDRCHPSVIMWSVGNEIYDMHADLRGTEVCRMLMNQVREHDPEEHAVVTFGCNYMPWEGGQRCADIVKVAGYNYGEKYYEDHHRKHPDWIIYGSETASVLSSRGIYHFPAEKSIMSESDLQCSSLGNSNTSWGALDLKKMIVDDLKCPFSLGQFIWSGIDYIGEPTPYHTRSCYFGQADTACFPKDSYFLFQSIWSGREVLHIGVSWDWNAGQLIDVPVMTSFGRVELLVNGKSLGIREADWKDAQSCLPVWKVPFEPGKLTARALDENGQVLREESKYTPGDTAELCLSAEEEELMSDGNDLAFVTVQAKDASGNPVENARDRITAEVSGGGYLVGTDNGDSSDADGYKENCRSLFSGKLLLIIASNGKKEDTVISVHSTGGLTSELILRSADADILPGTSCLQRIASSENAQKGIPVRKIEIVPLECRLFTSEHPSRSFTWKLHPEDAQFSQVEWQITNEAGILSPFTSFDAGEDRVNVTLTGDGKFFLRAMGGNSSDHPEIISQIELTGEGIGSPPLDPYGFVCAGLYDIHMGDIGTGNEKGIAFSRDGISMVGFSSIDFGKAGSDLLKVSVFALDDKAYDIELFDGDPRSAGKLISVLRYQKPSIWNTYQEESYRLPVRLEGNHTICFRMAQKVHMKGFVFEKQSRAYLRHTAGEADAVYGDSFARKGSAVCDIGNNVSLRFDEMDFGDCRDCILSITGRTPLNVNSITVRFRDGTGNITNEIVDFKGEKENEQIFHIRVPGGSCTVTFVFLPGSHFDFESFCFEKDIHSAGT